VGAGGVARGGAGDSAAGAGATPDGATSDDVTPDEVELYVVDADLDIALERFADDVGTLMRILRSFVASTPAVVEKLRAVEADTLSDYMITVHGLKGASRGICAEQIGMMAETLETAAKNNDFAYVEAHNEELLDAVSALLADLETLLAKLRLPDAV
jgi:HPt (histidine-containing phosphotransfer) domain-containing protein